MTMYATGPAASPVLPACRTVTIRPPGIYFANPQPLQISPTPAIRREVRPVEAGRVGYFTAQPTTQPMYMRTQLKAINEGHVVQHRSPIMATRQLLLPRSLVLSPRVQAPRTVMPAERYRAPLTTSSLVYGTPATGYRTVATPVQPPAAAPPNTCGPVMYRPVRSYHSLNTSGIPMASSSFVSATPAVPPASVALSGVDLVERRNALERGSPNREWLDESLSVPPAIRAALARLAPGGRGNQLTRHILAPVSEGTYSTLGYYDKRRVENNLRRFLEHIEEWWNENEESDVDLGKLFDKYVAAAEKALGESQRRSGGGSSSCGVHEPLFRQRLTSLSLWPAGLALGDKQEVFTSIVVPTAKALRGCSKAHRIPTLMTKSQFVERLVDVPFNVPDYPVPADKLTAQHLSAGEVATYLAEAVLEADLKEHEVVGVGPSSRHKAVLKDFTACGLVSVEELQALLFAQIAVGREHARNPLRIVTRDGLFPLKIVEAAVMKIIRRTVSLLPEWRTRNRSPSPEEALPRSARESIHSSPTSSPAGQNVPSTAYRRYTRDEEGGRVSSTVVEPEFEPPATMPAQTRCIGYAGPVRMEEYRRYCEGRADASKPVALDWSSWRMPKADSSSKTSTRPADIAAGMECVNLEDSFGGCEPGKSYERGGKRNRPESTSAELALGIYKDIDEVRLKIRDDPTGDIAGSSLAESFLEHLQEYRAASGRREPKRKYRKVARRTVAVRPRKILREELPVVVNEQHRAAVEEFMREAKVTASELRRSPPSQALKSAVRNGLCVYWHKEKGWHYFYLNPIGVFDDPQVSSAYVNSSRAESLRDNFDDLLQAVAIVTYLDSLPHEPDM
ncbi:hypothetical protein FOZ60_011331 [Perkinsus olseni]|uniref:Uncharacterized protein n=1 Tax=Perkinsus olseni TaxID=32597 RepID=A0A7J6NDS7_PEROL|nr:hypothetical protein FOZ60_011331 [Perkinsus olseni]